MGKEIGSGGEVEIERIPTHTIEARSKHLVPVFDYLQTSKYQKTRYAEVAHIFYLPISMILSLVFLAFWHLMQLSQSFVVHVYIVASLLHTGLV